MVNLNIDSSLKILEMLGECPSTSFHENLIFQCIKRILSSENIPFKTDTYGNILARIEGTKPQNKPVAFVAHMDHPGFELVEKLEDSIFRAKTLGGLPKLCEINESKVKIINEKNVIYGKILFHEKGKNPSNFRFSNSDRWLNKENVIIEVENNNFELPAPAVFDLPNPIIKNNEIMTPVADDLAGCALILETLKSLKDIKTQYSFRGIFSRAEEVGLYGARLIANSNRISKKSIIVSVETSSELPGARSGFGPIIRTGDRSTTFNNDGEIILLSAVKEILKTNRSFKFQRQLMDLGGSEATAFSAFGYKVTGISLPLINWHNSNDSGSVESERISLTDYDNALNIMTKVGKLDIVENKDYYKNLIEIPIEANRLEKI